MGDYSTSCPWPETEKPSICESIASATGFDFDSIRRYILEQAKVFLLFDASMGAGDNVGESVDRDLAGKSQDRDREPDGAGGARGGFASASQREEDARANSLGLVITAAMLFVLFAAAMLFGSRGSIGSLPHHMGSTPDAKTMGNLLYGMHTVAPCPQTSFDKATGSLPGPPELCLGADSDAPGRPQD